MVADKVAGRCLRIYLAATVAAELATNSVDFLLFGFPKLSIGWRSRDPLTRIWTWTDCRIGELECTKPCPACNRIVRGDLALDGLMKLRRRLPPAIDAAYGARRRLHLPEADCEPGLLGLRRHALPSPHHPPRCGRAGPSAVDGDGPAGPAPAMRARVAG